VAGACERGNEPSGSMDCGEILDRLPISFSGGNLLHGICSVR
jgi:hypothetical protein